jgi:hypothetical protein
MTSICDDYLPNLFLPAKMFLLHFVMYSQEELLNFCENHHAATVLDFKEFNFKSFLTNQAHCI